MSESAFSAASLRGGRSDLSESLLDGAHGDEERYVSISLYMYVCVCVWVGIVHIFIYLCMCAYMGICAFLRNPRQSHQPHSNLTPLPHTHPPIHPLHTPCSLASERSDSVGELMSSTHSHSSHGRSHTRRSRRVSKFEYSEEGGLNTLKVSVLPVSD